MLRVLLFAFLFVPFTLCAQPAYRVWFDRAEKLFNLENPTSVTDSIARTLYLDVASAALKEESKLAIASLTRAATIYQTYKQYQAAIKYYRRSLEYNLGELKDSTLLYEAYLYLGSAFYQLGINDSAHHYFENASRIVEFSRSPKSYPEQERLYNSLGAIYYEGANYSQAINYFQKALEFDSDDVETRVSLQSNIANCLVQLRRFDEGIAIFKSLLQAKQINRVITHNIAHAYFLKNEYDSSFHYFLKVSRQQDEVTVRMLNDVSIILINKNNFPGALRALDSSLRITNALFNNIPSRDRAVNSLVRSTLA